MGLDATRARRAACRRRPREEDASVRHLSRVAAPGLFHSLPRADTSPRGDPVNQGRSKTFMINRWMAVVLGAAVLAVPGTALAKNDHAKNDKASEKSHKHGSKHEKKHGKKDKSAKAKKAVTFVFKGVYKGAGVVTVAKGNAHVRKGGYVGQDVTFDMSAAKLVVADTDGVPGVTVADLQVNDVVLVQARQARGTKAPVVVPADDTAAASTETEEAPVADEAPSAIKARKVVDKTHPPVSDDDEDK